MFRAKRCKRPVGATTLTRRSIGMLAVAAAMLGATASDANASCECLATVNGQPVSPIPVACHRGGCQEGLPCTGSGITAGVIPQFNGTAWICEIGGGGGGTPSAPFRQQDALFGPVYWTPPPPTELNTLIDLMIDLWSSPQPTGETTGTRQPTIAP